MRRHTFTAVFQQEGEWWAARVLELPGAHSQGKTLDEARENLREAVQLLLEVNSELAERELGDTPTVREPLDVSIAA